MSSVWDKLDTSVLAQITHLVLAQLKPLHHSWARITCQFNLEKNTIVWHEIMSHATCLVRSACFGLARKSSCKSHKCISSWNLPMSAKFGGKNLVLMERLITCFLQWLLIASCHTCKVRILRLQGGKLPETRREMPDSSKNNFTFSWTQTHDSNKSKRSNYNVTAA